jgi:predicted nuclease with TOPRIM domain
MLADAKASGDRITREHAQLSDRSAKLQVDLEEQIHQNAALLAENGQKTLALKAKDDEIVSARAETSRVARLRDQAAKKVKALEEAREAAEQQRDTLKLGTSLAAHACAL